MPKQAIIWTALPNDYVTDGSALRLSILMSPRLTTDKPKERKLETFPDLVDWPATIAQTRFVVRIGTASVAVGGGEVEGAHRIDTTLGVPDSALWTALFPPGTYVRNHEFKDQSGNAVLSYDTMAMHGLVQGLYARLAANATDQLPKASAFLDDPGWQAVINTVAHNDRVFASAEAGSLSRLMRQTDVVGRPKSSGATLPQLLARFQMFHTPASELKMQGYKAGDPRAQAQWKTYEKAELPQAGDFARQIDFHQMVAAMNQYPTLLRRLGLVIDLVLEAGTFKRGANLGVSVTAQLPAAADDVERVPEVSPVTRTVLTADRFRALPRPSPQARDYRAINGLLDLDEQFDVLQTDVDGAGLKVMNFARSLALMRPTDARLDPTTKFEREAGAPALRNAGLMLVHRNRAGMLRNAFDRSKSLNASALAVQGGGGAAPELYAEDLTRGYRVDVWNDRTQRWSSLCERAGAYTVNAGAPDEVAVAVEHEEGTVRLAATKAADGKTNQDVVFLHEALTSWTGWSLCVPPPGNTVGKDDQVTDGAPAVPPGLRLQTRYAAIKGSLPRLRYGRKYWMRARVVDLAGNSLPPNEKDYGPESPQTRARPYLRYEPIAAPAVALVNTAGAIEGPAQGESMERMAIRTFNAAPADNNIPSTQATRRYAVPVQCTVREAEHHGSLDAAGALDPATFAVLAAQDHPLQKVMLDMAGPLPASPAVPTTYAIFDEGGELPYLPDPLATTIVARIFDLPGWDDAQLIEIPLYPAGAAWPDAQPFKVEIFEDPAQQPHWDEASRALKVPLPKAARALLRLSVMPAKEQLELLGVWHWLTPAQREKLAHAALSGQHWMLTPWRNIELVHAVQKPLIAPFMNVGVMRDYAKTTARPIFEATCSIKSTDRVDLEAEWNDPSDDVTKPAGANVARKDHAFSVKISDPKTYAMKTEDSRHTGIPEHYIVKEDVIRLGGLLRDQLVPPKVHELNDTRYRRIEYWLEATTRFREFMPPGVLLADGGAGPRPTDENIKVIGERVRTWIPNSAAPEAPEILYVVPTFGWVRSEHDGTQSSWRRGGGLRVYINRPWNVSGYGEMLAVVLPPQSFAGDPTTEPIAAPYKSYVTQWGNDPIWESEFVNGIAPRRANFPLARWAPDAAGKWLPDFAPATEADQPPATFDVTGLRHPTLRNSTTAPQVEIAPHDVYYDSERGLWYCDIEVDANTAYFPFIRLALARYQPVSIRDAHLSGVVLADFMPLAADRWLSVTQDADARVRRINVSGHSYTDSSSSVEARHGLSASIKLPDGTIRRVEPPKIAPSSVIEVWVERLDPALGEDFGWQREPDAIVARDSSSVKTPTRARRVRITAERKLARERLEVRDHMALMREGMLDLLFVRPVLWQGRVTLPENAGSDTRYRLVIAEYEEYLTDDDSPYDRFITSKGRRLVYVEHVELR